MEKEYKYPIVYVIRKLIRNGKPVAYFASPAQLFSEIKKYKPDGKMEMSYEIDYLEQMYDDIKCKIENSPTCYSYYKEEAYTTYNACKIRANHFNNMLLVRATANAEMEGADEETINTIKKRYEFYFKYANRLGEEQKSKLETSLKI